MIPTAAIVAEGQRRNYLLGKTLAVLMLAIDENWAAIPAGFFDALDALAHPTTSTPYDLAQLRGLPPTQWQAFTDRLYGHLRQAVDLLDGKEPDPTMITENGWPSCGANQLNRSVIPGTNVVLPLQAGQPNTIMKAFAADYHASIEPILQADCGGWTATNSVSTSNHLGGTAMDLRWLSHPFHVSGTFTAVQRVTIGVLLDYYEGNIFWGGLWRSPIDEMHWQMGYDTYQSPDTADFINRKILPTGFSRFGATEDWNPMFNEIMGVS